MKKTLLILCAAILMLAGPALAGQKTVVVTWEHEIPSDMGQYEIFIDDAVMTGCGGAGVQTVVVPYVSGMALTKDVPITSPDGQAVIWHARMRACDIAGNCSACSTEATIRIDFEAPGIPTNVKLVIKVTP